ADYKMQVISQFTLGLRVQTDTSGGTVASFGGSGDFLIDSTYPGGRFSVKEDGRVFISGGYPVGGAKLNISSGYYDDSLVTKAMSFEHLDGGFRHWIRTRHGNVGHDNFDSNSTIDFFLNTSANQNGSTGPGVGSTPVMTLASATIGQNGPETA